MSILYNMFNLYSISIKMTGLYSNRLYIIILSQAAAASRFDEHSVSLRSSASRADAMFALLQTDGYYCSNKNFLFIDKKCLAVYVFDII